MDYLVREVGIKINYSVIKEYWRIKRDVEKEPWATLSPATPQHCPLALFGDSCKVKGEKKQLGIFMSCPLWRPNSTRCSRWLVVSIEEDRLWGTETLDTILAQLVYSCNLLYEGWDGAHQLAHGMVFTITELKGDWLYHKFCWQFSSSWKKYDNICYLCDAKGQRCGDSELFWNSDGNWHEFTRGEFLTEQLSHRQRLCS